MNTLNEQDAATPPHVDSTRLIPLTQGQFAIVDSSDFEWLSQWKWFAVYDKRGDRFYAKTSYVNDDGWGCSILMHRLLTKAPKGMMVDHRNGNSLDNTRFNIRVCTALQNCVNRAGYGSSGYKGVRWMERSKKWYAVLKINGKDTYLGGRGFSTREEAARVYDDSARKHHGEFARLNFPENNY